MTKDQFVFTVMSIISLLLSISVHEWAHAKMADYLGDDTPRRQGRVTLTPWVHWDLIGTIGIIISSIWGMGIGWGKPVMTDPRRYTRVSRHNGRTLVAAAGPISNLILALLFAIPVRFGWLMFDPEFTDLWAQVIVLVNLSLFLFNLIPIPPLDGSKIILALCSERTAEKIEFQYQKHQVLGMILFIAMISMKIHSLVLGPIITFLFDRLIGR